MQSRASWLFPLMVLAAAAAIAFGALGILAITDRAPTLSLPSHPLNKASTSQPVIVTTMDEKLEATQSTAAPPGNAGARP